MSMPSSLRRSFNASDLVGAPVDTTEHGPGIVRKVLARTSSPGPGASTATTSGDEATRLVVELKEKCTTGQSHGGPDGGPAAGSPIRTSSSGSCTTVLLTTADLACFPICAPGTPVLTSIGTGVLISFRPRDSIYVVRIWHPRGAGSALAYLNRSAMIRPLPAAVGIRAATPQGHGIVVKFTEGVGEECDSFHVKLYEGGVVAMDGRHLSSPVAKVRCFCLCDQIWDCS